jgi:hypothetical protein
VRVGCALGDTAETQRYLDECDRRIPRKTPEQATAIDSSRSRLAYVQGELPRSMELAVRCVAAVRDAPELRAYQCFPANVVGRARCISGRFGEALDILTQGCDLARETREYVELSHSEGLLGVSHAFTGDFASAWRHALISIDLARRLGDPQRIMGALVYRAAVCEASFDWKQGVRDTTELLAFAEEHSMGGLYLYVGTVFTGRHQFHVGNLGRARVLIANAINLSMVLKMSAIRSWAHAFLGDVHFVSGQLEQARLQYTLGIDLARANQGDHLAEPLCLAGLAHIAALAKAPVSAVRVQVDEAVARLRAVANQSTLVPVLQRGSEALSLIGETDAAVRCAAQREEIVASLRLKACDFWPLVPHAAHATSPPPPPRDYWTQRTTDAAGSDPQIYGMTRHASADMATQAESATRRTSLMDSLADVEGFLPRF